MSSDLKLDWATHKAAKHAVEHWHYAKTLPYGKLAKIGAWERGRFVGVMVFAYGANNSICKHFGLKQTECCELVRVAMRDHESPITRMISIALRMLRAKYPSMRLVVSYADTAQGHTGGIYKGGNWMRWGTSDGGTVFAAGGKTIHRRQADWMRERSARRRPSATTIDWLRKNVDPNASIVKGSPKHRFLMPLDADMRASIEKRLRAGSRASDATGVQPVEGGATPTPALQASN